MNMSVEYATAPLAIGTRSPRFSWEVPLEGRGRKQKAYQILVATMTALLETGKADFWDSGRVDSAQSVNVPYAGRKLRSNMDYFWTVQVWDEVGHAKGFCPAQCFGTALFDESDWKAKWIGMGAAREPVLDPDSMRRESTSAGLQLNQDDLKKLPPEFQAFEPDLRAPLLRKVFSVGKKVVRARAFVCGLGLFELRLNGRKVGTDVLATPRTDFRKRVFYFTYDITRELKSGENVVGVMLGNGWANGQKKFWHWQMPWYCSPRALVQIEIEFEDGLIHRVVSDGSWQGDWSPITFNCIYDGEDYDARRVQEGWDSPGFSSHKWNAANLVSSPGGRLVAMDHEANQIVETFKPLSTCEPKPGVLVYDMGTVMTGWARLRIPHGTVDGKVILRYAELQNEDGMVNCDSAGGARQADVYIMRGVANEVYEPRFTYHGFRYVEMTGYPGKPDLDSLEACFVRNAVAQTGAFECGHEQINKIHRCTLQSQRCNLQMGVPTDDTQREERLGWAGDAWSYAQESFCNLDTARFWTKWIADFYDQQDQEFGVVGYICPLPGLAEDLVWSAAFVLIPWWHYVHYGDRRILELSYPYLKKYITYLERVGRKDIPALSSGKVVNALLPGCGRKNRFPSEESHGYLQRSLFGDHLATHEGSSGFCKDHPRSMATAFYYHDVTTMARIAETLGKAEDARCYHELSDKIRLAYNKYFFDANLGYYDIGCQSAQALALVFGLVPDEYIDRVAGYLCSSVNYRQRRITSGYAGTKWVVNAIANAGRNDIVWNRAIATDYPSWGYMLHDNKTTITENWHGSASQCHTTLGAAIDEWFYWGLVGIRPDETAPGFEKIVFKPYLPPDLDWARGSIRTARGLVSSEWRKEGATALLTITVPANSTATVHVPAKTPDQITESGVTFTSAKGVVLLRSEEGVTVFQVGSGTYSFSFPTP